MTEGTVIGGEPPSASRDAKAKRAKGPDRRKTFDHLRRQNTVAMTTFRRDGTPVSTPVSIAVGEDPTHGYVRTWTTAGKFKRLRNNNQVKVAPSTFNGKEVGPYMWARARRVKGAEEDRARRLIQRKHPILHGIVVPVLHKLRGHHTCHFELRPAA
ncbi:MAG: PPOX class F420-dependent oxidoreductase [Acidimicrobiia bacterium]|nr:PPOX class F420-dependent oxidoreductase [Acidimicrobiia bacterium]